MVNVKKLSIEENFEDVQWLIWTGRLKLEKNVGVEVGVRDGNFSSYLLANNPNLVLHLVDPYLEYLDITDQLYTQFVQDQIKTRAIQRMSVYKERAAWCFKPSVIAAAEFKLNTLDFVFIDATHTGEALTEDIQAWYSKVRSGGLLMGHDYNLDELHPVVNKFAESLNKTVYHLTVGDVWFIEV